MSHISPKSTYYTIFGILMGLTALTVFAATILIAERATNGPMPALHPRPTLTPEAFVFAASASHVFGQAMILVGLHVPPPVRTSQS